MIGQPSKLTIAIPQTILYYNLPHIPELHVDHQDLEADQNLVFDPRSCSKLKKLRVLNTSKNQMLDLKPLDMIPNLTQLDISGNLLKDLQRTIEILARIPSLQVCNNIAWGHTGTVVEENSNLDYF